MLLSYWVVGLVALLESVVVVGFVMPGALVVVLAGFLAAKGVVDVGGIVLFAAVGAVIGDVVSYYLGRRGATFFKEGNRLLTPRLLARGETFLKNHGDKGIFLGRFLGPIRPLVPFVAGMFNMSKVRFLIWNILSAIVWAGLYALLGFFFGHAWQVIAIWSTRAVIFLLAILIVLFVIYLIRRAVISRGAHMAQLLSSIVRSVVGAVITNKEVQELVERHPRFFRFWRQRLTIRHFTGLPLTLLMVVFSYVLSLFFGLTESIIQQDPIVAVDSRLANLLMTFRSEPWVTVFLWVTLLGKWQMVGLFLLAAVIIMWVQRQRYYILPLLVAIAGSEVITTIGKFTLHRPRPVGLVPAYIEHSFSFPSGHATIAIALYGFITYYLWQQVRAWRWKVNLLFVGIIIILAVGLSRLYLGVHFLSDVLSGYLVGLLWLIVGITIVEWQKSRRQITWMKRKIIIIAPVMIIAVVAYMLFAWTSVPQIDRVLSSDQIALQIVAVDDLPKAFDDFGLPRFTETLVGNPQEPISLVVIAANDAALVEIFQAAGWQLADQLGAGSLYRIVKAAAGKQAYARAPITPSFWHSNVHDFGFEKLTALNVVTERHHARFWKTAWQTQDKRQVYVGTASFDTSLKWLVTHKIEPAIDTERYALVADLQNAGVVISSSEWQFVAPTLGQNFSGDQFFTDGQAFILEVRSGSEAVGGSL